MFSNFRIVGAIGASLCLAGFGLMIYGPESAGIAVLASGVSVVVIAIFIAR